MKILNFGSLNIDFVYQVEHFVRPGETISSLQMDKHCGGKGLNQSIALAKAGAEVYHGGKYGADGDVLVEKLRENGVNTQHLVQSSLPNGHAIIQVDRSGQNCIILYGGSNTDQKKEDIEQTLSFFGAGDLLLLQNEVDHLDEIMRQAHARGMRIALNPSPITPSLLECPLELVEFFILNEIEGEEITKQNGKEAIADALVARFPGCKVVLTLGKDGVFYRDADSSHTHGIYKVPVVDTTAAGDTFTGFFLAAVAAGSTVPQALKNASIASSLAVSKMGAADSIPTLAQVKSADVSSYDK